MGARASWPARGWVWDPGLETYVPGHRPAHVLDLLPCARTRLEIQVAIDGAHDDEKERRKARYRAELEREPHPSK